MTNEEYAAAVAAADADLRWLREHAHTMNRCAPAHWRPGAPILAMLLEDQQIAHPKHAVWSLAAQGVLLPGFGEALRRARAVVEAAQ